VREAGAYPSQALLALFRQAQTPSGLREKESEIMSEFQLKRYEHRPATIEERDKMRLALTHARVKLFCYRKRGGEYVGGMEFTDLIREIDEALK